MIIGIPGVFGGLQSEGVNKPSAKIDPAMPKGGEGITFSGNLAQVAKAVSLQIADGAGMSGLQTAKEKELHEKPFDFEQAEEEHIDSCLQKIAKMLKLGDK